VRTHGVRQEVDPADASSCEVAKETFQMLAEFRTLGRSFGGGVADDGTTGPLKHPWHDAADVRVWSGLTR
jgi:hypothetical protein